MNNISSHSIASNNPPFICIIYYSSSSVQTFTTPCMAVSAVIDREHFKFSYFVSNATVILHCPVQSFEDEIRITVNQCSLCCNSALMSESPLTGHTRDM